ncbi:MAG: nucleotide exchange factor GrpE [Candidatus Hydrothermarchaeales archaeon]
MASTKGKRASKDTSARADTKDELKKAVEEKDNLAEEYLTKLKYLQAEFDNYRKSVTKEKETLVRYASENLLLELLDIYENLERTLENGKNDKKSLLQGVKMTQKEFKRLLDKEGVTIIKAVGEKFDPFKHEALMLDNNTKLEDNTIVEEYRRGYMLRDKVLRYSKVKVAKR